MTNSTSLISKESHLTYKEFQKQQWRKFIHDFELLYSQKDQAILGIFV